MLVIAVTSLLAQTASPSRAPSDVLADETRRLATLGITLRDERVLDRATGRILRRTTNAATGEVVDGDGLLLQEGRTRDEAHAKVSHELRDRLAAATGELPVVFWLERDAERPDLRQVIERDAARGVVPDLVRNEAIRVARDFTARVTQPFVAALEADGHRATYVDELAPIVFVDLDAEAVVRFASRADVDQVYYAFPTWEAEGPAVTSFVAPNEWASPTARTDAVHRRGVTGAGVKVLVNDVGSIAPGAYLPPLNPGTSSSPASHATAVAGMIASSHPVQTGAAPGLPQLLDYRGASDVEAPMAWSWAIGKGVSFGNCSWWNGNRGSIVFLDRYFDYIIRNFAVMMFKSCGNQGNGNPTTTPGNGFNMTSSGNSDDRDTHDWDDDRINFGSSTANPQPSDHETPQLAAPGTNITSTSTSGGVSPQGSGTSYASPVSCGTAALLAATDPVLKAKPEAVKAILMAGAWQNVHGTAPLSDFDGAGGVDAAASHSAVVDGQYVATTLTPASFSGGIWSHSFHLDLGDETRIVGLWFSNVDQSQTTDVLEMDLDMVVRGPGGAVVASSASTKNPFEILSFVPPSTGTYTVEMQQQRFLGVSEPFALAWNTSLDYAATEVTISGSTSIGGTVTFHWFDRYHPGGEYIGVMSITPYPATIRLPNKKLLPLGDDSVLRFSLKQPGFTGVLDGNGQATASVTIPNLLSLVGLPVHAAMMTIDTGEFQIEELSPVTSFVITN